jgi:hypothetical protein
MANELRDVAPSLWLWRVDYPDWHPGLVWERTVTSTCVESGGEVFLLDPLAPADDANDVWARLDARPPTVIIILKPNHVRDLDIFALVCPLFSRARDRDRARDRFPGFQQKHPLMLRSRLPPRVTCF